MRAEVVEKAKNSAKEYRSAKLERKNHPEKEKEILARLEKAEKEAVIQLAAIECADLANTLPEKNPLPPRYEVA